MANFGDAPLTAPAKECGAQFGDQVFHGVGFAAKVAREVTMAAMGWGRSSGQLVQDVELIRLVAVDVAEPVNVRSGRWISSILG